MSVSSYKDLVVWQKTITLIEQVYAVTSSLPIQEMYGLTSQMRRSSVSIASNIAEGSKRSTKADYRHFCTIALGSAAELETQLIVAQRLFKLRGAGECLESITEIQKMLHVLTRKLQP